MTNWKRLLTAGSLFALAACVATPLPQPPSFELDTGAVDVELSDAAVTFIGSSGALTPGSVDLRVSPGPTDSDPPLELGTATVAEDGSFTVFVVSPDDNIFFFEALTDDEDIFVIAVTIDGDAIVEADPGPDTDQDGSPDEIDCAPEDADLSGQRCD